MHVFWNPSFLGYLVRLRRWLPQRWDERRYALLIQEEAFPLEDKQEEGVLLVQEDALLLVQIEAIVFVQTQHVLLVQEENLLLVQEESLLCVAPMCIMCVLSFRLNTSYHFRLLHSNFASSSFVVTSNFGFVYVCSHAFYFANFFIRLL